MGFSLVVGVFRGRLADNEHSHFQRWSKPSTPGLFVKLSKHDSSRILYGGLMDEARMKTAGFWGLTLLAFAPTQQGWLGTVQKAVRLPINVGILWFFGTLILLFTSLWWVGILAHAAWYFVVPKTVKRIRARFTE